MNISRQFRRSDGRAHPARRRLRFSCQHPASRRAADVQVVGDVTRSPHAYGGVLRPAPARADGRKPQQWRRTTPCRQRHRRGPCATSLTTMTSHGLSRPMAMDFVWSLSGRRPIPIMRSPRTGGRVSPWNGPPGVADGTVFSGDPAADADGDGLTAWMEYVLGRDEAKRDPQSDVVGPAIASFPTGTGTERFLTMTFRRALAADDVEYLIESSENLGTLAQRPVSGNPDRTPPRRRPAPCSKRGGSPPPSAPPRTGSSG